MKLASAFAALTLSAGTALAGGFTAPVVEPTPVAPVVPVVSTDWSGFYAGIQLGAGKIRASDDVDTIKEDIKAYGLHAGYNHDLGQYVLGAELDYNKLDLGDFYSGDFYEDDKADLTRLRLRAGYDAGKFLPYVALGVAHLSGDGVSDNGATIGLGADYMFNDRFSVGGEYSFNKWDDFDDSGVDVKANLFLLRASYHF